ncbi:MAG: nuclear transport factor 2 family protein [Alphaproteobacteria bacterium]|nr:nuclear transport factor 2 family protein [Alphaproteobacteria bacterium]
MIRETERLIQAQLEAYNRRDLNAFIECYADTIELIYLSTNVIFCKGIAELHEIYKKIFKEHPLLYCRLTQRMICGDYVIDEEQISGLVDKKLVHTIATYQIKHGLIQKVWFIKN